MSKIKKTQKNTKKISLIFTKFQKKKLKMKTQILKIIKKIDKNFLISISFQLMILILKILKNNKNIFRIFNSHQVLIK